MNEQLQEFARSEIKLGLAKLEPENRVLFNRMFSHNDLSKNTNDVVDDIEAEKLDWVMQLVSRSLEK